MFLLSLLHLLLNGKINMFLEKWISIFRGSLSWVLLDILSLVDEFVSLKVHYDLQKKSMFVCLKIYIYKLSFK